MCEKGPIGLPRASTLLMLIPAMASLLRFRPAAAGDRRLDRLDE
jgi:hypothetical protein